jgi:heme ABC exporter ATP-binding subunit CcmA
MELVVHFRAAVALLGRFPALAGLDLDVAQGQIVHLRGQNGAGKTTFLRACAGLVPVVEGSAQVLGCDIRRNPRAVRRRVGLLGHATGLYDDLTVAENVRFWGRATKAAPADIAAALALVGMDGRLRDVGVSKLSAGQRRRTSLACLLARRPELWLLDEPHAGLDRAARDLVDDLVRQAVAQGATVVLSSHELDRAHSLADRTVEIAGGVAVEIDGPDPFTPTEAADSSPGSEIAESGDRVNPDTPGAGPQAPTALGEAAGVA